MDFDLAFQEAGQGLANQEPVELLMLALVVVREQIVVGSRFAVGRVIVAKDLDRGLHHALKGLGVHGKLRKNAQGALGGLVQQDVGGLFPAQGLGRDFILFHLELAADTPQKGILQRQDAVGVQCKGLHGLDVERVGQVGSDQLDPARRGRRVRLVGLGPRHAGLPEARGGQDGEALLVLVSPAVVDLVKAGRGNEAQVEQGLAGDFQRGRPDPVHVAAIHGEVGPDLVALGQTLFVLAGDPVLRHGAGLAHFQ